MVEVLNLAAPPSKTSTACKNTRSRPPSSPSIAGLNVTGSRSHRSWCTLVRMALTCRGLGALSRVVSTRRRHSPSGCSIRNHSRPVRSPGAVSGHLKPSIRTSTVRREAIETPAGWRASGRSAGSTTSRAGRRCPWRLRRDPRLCPPAWPCRSRGRACARCRRRAASRYWSRPRRSRCRMPPPSA